MVMQTVIWEPPCLCGCQLRITGDFDSNQIYQGFSYHHPRRIVTPDNKKVSSVASLEIVNVCTDHQSYTDPANHDDSMMLEVNQDGEQWQARGYLNYPITNPTPAECLFTYFWRYRGEQLSSKLCSCTAHITSDMIADDERTARLHPVFTKNCKRHKGDDGTKMYAEVKMTSALVNHIKDNFPAARVENQPDGAIPVKPGASRGTGVQSLNLADRVGLAGVVSIDDDGVVSLQPAGLADADKQAVQAWADDTLGAGKVVVG